MFSIYSIRMAVAPSPTSTNTQRRATGRLTSAQIIGNPYSDLHCRPYAKIVAFIDIICSPLESGLCIYFLVMSVDIAVKHGSGTRKTLYGFITVVVIHMICCLVEVYFAWRLLRGTARNAEHQEALRSARFWRILNVLLIILELVVSVWSGFIGYKIPDASQAMFIAIILARLAAILFVHKFIEELQSLIPEAQPIREELEGSLSVTNSRRRSTVPFLKVPTTISET